MKFFAVLVVCVALAATPSRANPFIFDAIGKGIETAGGIAEGIINGAGQAASNAANAANGIAQAAINIGKAVGTGAVKAGETGLSALNNLAANATKGLAQAANNIRNAALRETIRRVQDTIQKINKGTEAVIAAGEKAGDKIRDHILEVEDQMEESLQSWADKAKDKVADSDDETRQAGEKLVDELVNQRTEELKQCTDSILGQLEQLQEQANATAEKYHGPTQELIAEIGKCANTSASRCAHNVAAKLRPLLSAPGEFAALKLKIDRAALTNIRRHICILGVLGRFRAESLSVEHNLDILVKGAKTTEAATTSTTEDPTIYDSPDLVGPGSRSNDADNDDTDNENADGDAAADDNENGDDDSAAGDEPAAEDEPAADDNADDKKDKRNAEKKCGKNASNSGSNEDSDSGSNSASNEDAEDDDD